MGNEQWHAVIYFRNGIIREVAFSNDRTVTARHAQMIFEQEDRTAINDFFKPTRIEIVRDK